MPAMLEACLQVNLLLPPLRLLQKLLRSFYRVGIGVIVHNTHVVHTVRPVLTEVTDQEVSLLFCGL